MSSRLTRMLRLAYTGPIFSRTHSARRLSRTNHIAYYMNPTTLSKYTEQQLAELEVEIEEVYISDLKHKCRQERSWSENY